MLKKFSFLFLPLLILLCVCGVVVKGLVFHGYSMEESLAMLRHLHESGSRYTLNYSEDHFDQIQVGDSGRQVFERMTVPPFERHENDSVWLYSLPEAAAAYYHQRDVIFERDAENVPRVKATVKRFSQRTEMK
jgi:hypothetical protein